MAEKLISLVLRTLPYRETSVLVTLFSREWGKVRGVCRGVRGKKGPAKAALQPGNMVACEGLRKPGWEMWTLNKMEGLVHRQALAAGAGMGIGFLLDLTDRLSPEDHPDERVFRLVTKAVSCLEKTNGETSGLVLRDQVVVWCVAWLLRLSGFLPDLGHCPDCLETTSRGFRADRLGHLACSKCSPQGMSLSSRDRDLLLAIMAWNPESDPFEPEGGVPAGLLPRLEALLLHLARAHLGVGLASHQTFRAMAPMGTKKA